MVHDFPEVYEFDWPSVFKPGDVVRSQDGEWIGVVVAIIDFSPNETPRWELHVDAAKKGVPQAIGIWPPWQAIPAPDPQARIEAKRLGFRLP